MTALPNLTADEIATLRRMCGLAVGNVTYTDAVLSAYAQRYALPDRLGQEPQYVELLSSASAPTWTLNPYWTPTYDLNATAADIWQERAASLTDCFDFSADNASYKRSQKYDQYMRQARYYRSRRALNAITLRAFSDYPREEDVINAD